MGVPSGRPRSWIGWIIAGVMAVAAPAVVWAGKKKPEEPFYRRFLVSGDPLDERIRVQEKRVEGKPESADLRNDFGNLLAARKFPEQAREQYETAMKLDRKHFLAPYNLGLLYETEGRHSRAISAYEKSVDRNRGFPPSRFRLGRLYEKRGWNDRAIEQYARALRIDPSMRDPRRNPLVVDTRLMDRVSLSNYEKDLAFASMTSEAAYAEGERMGLGRVPVDRRVWSDEILDPAQPEPIPAVAPTPTPMPAVVPGSSLVPPQSAPPAPPPTSPPSTTILPPPPVEFRHPPPPPTAGPN